jgi:MFS family permease
MVWSAAVGSFGHLVISRLFLGIATASAGPVVASMLGDWFASAERGRIYSYVLTGELLGAGLGFAVTGDVAALSWRLSFLLLAIPAFLLAWAVLKLPEPVRGARAPLTPGTQKIPRMARARYHRSVDRDSIDELPETDAQRVSREKGVAPDDHLVLDTDARTMGLIAATRYVLSVRTNVAMIVASAFGYFYLTGVQTFGAELVHQQYGINQALANLLMLVVGAGAVVGVLLGGRLGDSLLARGYLNSRLLVSAIAAGLAVIMFVPALATHRTVAAVPYLALAALGISAQNPPLNAARLDIMPPALWGRAEGIRTFLRTAAQALAPLIFGGVSDIVFGGGHNALHWTFLVMLLPLAASAVLLVRAMATYPRDVATAAANTRFQRSG